MQIKYMLDTNIASYLIKGNAPHLEHGGFKRQVQQYKNQP